jgi:hypothetical protein
MQNMTFLFKPEKELLRPEENNLKKDARRLSFTFVLQKIPLLKRIPVYFRFLCHPFFISPIYPLIAVRVVLSRMTEKSRSTTKTGKNPVMVFLFIV